MFAQLLLGTIANLSLQEHRMAISTATYSLYHLRVCTLSLVHGRASRKCLPSLPLLRIPLGRLGSLERWTLTTYRLPILS